MDLLPLFNLAPVAGLAAGALWSLYIARHAWQRELDMRHVTYTLKFPATMTDVQASAMFSLLSGVYPSVGRWLRAHGRPTFVLEVLGTAEGVQHRISFPKEFTDPILTSLAAAVPGIGFEETPPDERDWHTGLTLRARDVVLKEIKGEDDDGEKWVIDPDVDPREIPHHVARILGSFNNLQGDEAVMAQFVVTPIGNNISPGMAGQFWAAPRLAVSTKDRKRQARLLGIVAKAYQNLQVFKGRQIPPWGMERVNKRQSPVEHWPCRLDGKTLALLFALPVGAPNIPGMVYARGRKLVPAPAVPSTGIVIGQASFPGKARPVAVQAPQLLSHAWVLGPTGSGKSTLLENLAAGLMGEGHGLVVIEPKGDLCRNILAAIPQHRVNDLIWFDPSERERPIGLNILGGTDPERTTGNVVALFKSLYGDSWGPRLEQVLKYTVLTAAMAGLTLYDAKQLLLRDDFRASVLKGIRNPDIKQFWRFHEEGPGNAKDSVLNKLDAFVGLSLLRNIVGQPQGLDMDEVVNKNKILLVPLNGAVIGEENASIIGSVLVEQLWQAIRSRLERNPMYLLIDEWQRFFNLPQNMEGVLAEARGHGLGTIVANQTIAQLAKNPGLLAGADANLRTKIAFGMGPRDANVMADVLRPLKADDLQALELHEIAAQILTSEGLAPTVTAFTAPPVKPTGFGLIAQNLSRQAYGVPVEEIESMLAERINVAAKPDRPKFGQRELPS